MTQFLLATLIKLKLTKALLIDTQQKYQNLIMWVFDNIMTGIRPEAPLKKNNNNNSNTIPINNWMWKTTLWVPT